MNYYYRSIASETMSDFETFYRKMADQFSSVDPINIIEVGIADGRSIVFMASYMKSLGKICNIYGVDNFDYGKDYQRNVINQNIIRSGEDNIKIINLSSLDASCTFEDNFFDLVFIDSSHLYEQTKAEIRLWSRKVKLNGVLSGHDYWLPTQDRPEPMNDVIRAVNEVIPVDKLIVEDTSYHLGVWQVTKTEDLKIN